MDRVGIPVRSVSTTGDTFTEAEIRDWMTAAGLGTITRFDTPFGTGIVTGCKGEE